MSLTEKEIQLGKHLNKTVLGDPWPDNCSGIMDYALTLGYRDAFSFLDDLWGNMTLDVGSGYGGLIRELSIKGLDTNVISLNPRLILPRTPLENTQEIERLLGGYSKEKVVQAESVHNHRAFAAYAQFLPFADASFRVVLDRNAVLMHSQTFEELEAAFKEFHRVLGPGGMLRTAPFLNPQQEIWARQIFGTLGMHFNSFIYPQGSGQHTEFMGGFWGLK